MLPLEDRQRTLSRKLRFYFYLSLSSSQIQHCPQRGFKLILVSVHKHCVLMLQKKLYLARKKLQQQTLYLYAYSFCAYISAILCQKIILIISNSPHDHCFFLGPDSLFHASMCKTHRGTSDTIAKRRKAMKCWIPWYRWASCLSECVTVHVHCCSVVAQMCALNLLKVVYPCTLQNSYYHSYLGCICVIKHPEDHLG